MTTETTGTAESVADTLRRQIEEAEREQLHWIAAHALRRGLYELPRERRAHIDPLGMLHANPDGYTSGQENSETIARQLTDEELREAHDAGEGDYWEVADGEVRESHSTTEGRIAGMRYALALIEETRR